MVVCKRDAHLALNQLSDYRNRLDSQKDGLLVEALNRLMNVFQSRLFLGLLDIQEFYEAILLDPQKTKEEKTSAALEIASKWENISSPSLVASTTDLRIPNSLINKTNYFDRARSMYHINLNDSQISHSSHHIQSSPHHHHHLPDISNFNKSWKHIEPSLNFEYQTLNSLNNISQSSSQENISNDHVKSNNYSKFINDNLIFTHNKFNQNLYDIKNQSSSIIPIVKPRQKRLKQLKSNSIHDLNENIFSKTNNGSYFNDQFLIAEDNIQTNPLNDDDDDEVNNKQWALLNRLPITMEVIIDKSSKGFGFSIAGGHDNKLDPNNDDNNDSDIYVTRVNPGGPADHQSGLQLGDRILSVNGISLIGATHNEAVKALQLAGSRLKLIIERKAELAISEQDSLMSFSSSYSHSKVHMNPSLKQMTATKLQPSSSSSQSINIVQNIESTASTSTGGSLSGGGGGGGGVGGKSIESGTSLTTTSLISGSLFDYRDSKQTLNSTGISSKMKSSNIPISPSRVSIEQKIQQSTDTDLNDIMLQNDQKVSQPNVIQSSTGSKLSRRGVACTGFPAFSWCGGLQRVTGGCASLGRGHHSLQGSSRNSSRQKLTGSIEPNRTVRSNEFITVGARPTPPPKPGPLVVEVILTRGTKSGLGFSITGGVGNETSNGDSGIFVTKLTSGGVAETDGRIRIGDRIVQVNDTPLVDVTHEQAVRVLKQAGDQVRLVLVKRVNHSSRQTSSSDIKIGSSELNNQDHIVYDTQFNGSNSRHSVGTVDQYYVKSDTPPVSLSSLHRSTSTSPSSSAHSSPHSEVSVHNSVHMKLSTNHDKDEQNNENFSSSPNLSNEKVHKPSVNEMTTTNIPCFASTGQELLENRMVGIIDYAAAASVSDLLNQWPNARLVTLYRNGRKRVSSISRERLNNSEAIHRGFSSNSRGSLGLNIVGGDGSEATFISYIQPNKPAGLSKRIFVGDRLLTVNGIDVTKFGHEKAAAALRDARDRVDLLVVYSPEEYAEFEKHFCRQLKAVEKIVQDKQPINSHQFKDINEKKLKQKNTMNKQVDKSVHSECQQQKRQLKKKDRNMKIKLEDDKKSNEMITYSNVLILRCQVDYDPTKENHHQSIPKKVFNLRSGDLIYIVNTVDSEWWQAQRFDPEKNEPTGPIGLIPSRSRLERKERTRTRHVNFIARNSRSVDSPSVKSNDAYERRKNKSLKPSTSTYSLAEAIGQCKDFSCSKGGTISTEVSHSSRSKSKQCEIKYLSRQNNHVIIKIFYRLR
ncbi:unnamed protein product [Heterobilharzia americana]|nr:unnamed protein product [Heterobilharzia americana]